MRAKAVRLGRPCGVRDRKSTRLNSSHRCISYAVFCLKKQPPTPKPSRHSLVRLLDPIGRQPRQPEKPPLAQFTQAGLRLLFFNDPATTEIYTLSLHDALPIWVSPEARVHSTAKIEVSATVLPGAVIRSEEHTSELQSPMDLVCRLLLEKI